MNPPRVPVVVVGGGLAGLSAAFELSERQVRVLLVEACEVVGGRTASWSEDGMPVESGLHRFLGFFSVLPRLLERAGADLGEIVCWEDEFEIRLPDGGAQGILGMSPLHKPLRTVGGFVANKRPPPTSRQALVEPLLRRRPLRLHPQARGARPLQRRRLCQGPAEMSGVDAVDSRTCGLSTGFKGRDVRHRWATCIAYQLAPESCQRAPALPR